MLLPRTSAAPTRAMQAEGVPRPAWNNLALPALGAPHQIIEIHGELIRPADVVLELLDVRLREFRRDVAGGLGEHLDLRGILEHDRADHHLLDGRRRGDDAV